MPVERRVPISVSEAVRKVMEYDGTGEVESVYLEQAYHRYLAEPLKADHDVPPFHKSPYDGFAIRAEDFIDASLHHALEFEIVDEIGAGFISSKVVEKNQAVRVMTGAQMPNYTNAVVMLELATEYERNGKKYMSIKRSYKKGDNVSFQGEDASKGTPLVERGTVINPGVQALLATFGYQKVPVSKKPLIGVFATGTELLDVGEQLVPGKIRNSNSYMLNGQIQRSGATPRFYGKLKDDFEACYEAIKQSLHEVDLLITTGGVSVGDYDYLPAVYKKLGAEVLFNKVAMRPGSVTTVAQWKGKLLFGLSGNPSACFVGYELFVRPVVRKLLFSNIPHLKSVKASLGEDFPKPNPFTRFVRGTLFLEDGRVIVTPSGLDKSNAVTSLARADALIVLPGGTRGFTKGRMVTVLLLEDTAGSEWPWNDL